MEKIENTLADEIDKLLIGGTKEYIKPFNELTSLNSIKNRLECFIPTINKLNEYGDIILDRDALDVCIKNNYLIYDIYNDLININISDYLSINLVKNINTINEQIKLYDEFENYEELSQYDLMIFNIDTFIDICFLAATALRLTL